jgi:hypothetical protein
VVLGICYLRRICQSVLVHIYILVELIFIIVTCGHEVLFIIGLPVLITAAAVFTLRRR